MESTRCVSTYRFGDIEVDLRTGEVRKGGAPVHLEPKAFELLVVLVESRGRLLSKQDLLDAVWPDAVVSENALTRLIAQLRKALDDDARNARYIATVPSRGYRFVAETADVVPRKAPSRRLGHVLLTSLAVAAAAGAWLLSFPAETELGPPRIVPLTWSPAIERDPSFAPDGDTIAYARSTEAYNSGFDIYVRSIDGTVFRRITDDARNELAPTWSPDGRSIAFLRDAETGWDVIVTPVLGGAERRVGTASSYRGLAWSPDGEDLVLVGRDAPEEPEGIYRLSLRTGEKQRMTMPSETFDGRFPRDGRPAISSDGKWIAFRRSRRQGHQDVHRVPFGGGPVERLTFDDAHVQAMAFASDGGRIIFSSNRDGRFSLWSIDVEGGAPFRLSPDVNDVFGLFSVSRRGRRLAYGRATRNLNIWRMAGPSARESVPPTTLIGSTWWDSQPAYSPDGEWIGFVSQRSGYPEIWVCPADASEAVRLTSLEQPNGNHLHPRWSPDGRQIVFQSSKGGDWNIFVVDREGRDLRALTTERSEEVHPSWSRDGGGIYFGSNRSGEFQIWRMPAQGGSAVPVTRHGGFEAFESHDGNSLYYVKPDSTSSFARSPSPGIWRVPPGGGAETKVVDKGYRGSWALTDDGICFTESEDPAGAVVSFYSFASGAIRPVGTVEGRLTNDVSGFSVSPDGRWILYTRQDEARGDIMMVENFR